MLVIDDEGSIIPYELSISEPSCFLDIDSFSESITDSERNWYSLDKWEFNHVGIPTRWGHRLNPSETILIETDNVSITSTVHLDLLSRGLALRSGFKYGTHWRAYSGPVGKDHAPYLIDTRQCS